MQRFTISLEEQLAEDFDRLIAERGYANRSEAVRDLLRAELERTRAAAQHAVEEIERAHRYDLVPVHQSVVLFEGKRRRR